MKNETCKPISPKDIMKVEELDIPDYIIRSVNELLAKTGVNLNNEIVLPLASVVDLCLENAPEGVTEDVMHKQEWLDFEPVFERCGWKVEFRGPGNGASFDSVYKFRAI